jgi:RimJ/RimL family protein N-acetyltransferase
VLTPALPADIPTICAIEARADNRGRIGEWTAELHRARMAASNVAYFAWRARADDPLLAFAILERLDDPNGCAYLRRIAAASPGGGHGAALLAALLDWLFAETPMQKLELRVISGNPARRLYERMGFVEEGILENRPHPSFSHVMSMLRADWETRGERAR